MNCNPTPGATPWKDAVLAYAAHLNAYIQRGEACQWKGMGEPDPAPDLQAQFPALLQQLRAANASGSEAAVADFRALWPPLHEATLPLVEDNGQGIGALAWLPNGDLLVRTGAWYQPGGVMKLRGVHASHVPDVDMFGLSPNQQVLALAIDGAIRLVRSSDQQLLAQLARPTGSEGLPPGYPTTDADDSGADGTAATPIEQLIALDDGRGAVVVQSSGVFLVTLAGTRRLLPLAAQLQEELKGGHPYPVRLDMCHAAVSPDGRWIVCGAQDGHHCVFNAQGEAVDHIGPHGEYPHHAAFFADGRHAAFNACHFYNGGTIAVAVSAFGSIQTDFYDDHPAVTVIDTAARVYASAPAGDSLVLGDAQGYLRVRNPAGDLQWQQHVGSTISAMAASADGHYLAVGSYSGTVHIIDLTNTAPGPEQVGVRARKEVRRWLFWTQQDRPLAW